MGGRGGSAIAGVTSGPVTSDGADGARRVHHSRSNGTSVSLPFSTYIGGSGDEDIQGGFVAIDSTGDIYVVGDTNSMNLPIQVSPSGALADSSLNGGQGLQSTCQVLNPQTQQQLTIVCPDAFVERYTADTSGILVTLAGVGTGTVSSNPSGINCPGVGTCSGSFANNQQVTLTATPTAGSTFAGWSGAGCPSSGVCSITLNANQFVTATFNPPVHHSSTWLWRVPVKAP